MVPLRVLVVAGAGDGAGEDVAHDPRSTRHGGNWLQKSGLPIGQRYSMELEDGELAIRAL